MGSTASGKPVKKLIMAVSAVAAVAILTVFGTDAVLTAATPTPTPTPTSSPQPTPTRSPIPEPPPAEPPPAELPPAEPTPTASWGSGGATTTVIVTRIVDGDTIDTSVGKVRVIGIDTPERGDCGYETATSNAATIVPVGSTVTLTAASGKDDTDKYDRLLRYVTAEDGTDLGMAQIQGGLADARYDSRDGYGWHPKEGAYIAADTTPNGSLCSASPDGPAPVAAATGAEPWNSPGPDLDCSDIGHVVSITGPDYHRLDRDGDGVACESYS